MDFHEEDNNIITSSRSQMFLKIGVLKNLESLFNKVAGHQACNFTKKRLLHRCFPMNIVKFLRVPFFYRTPPVAAFLLSYCFS